MTILSVSDAASVSYYMKGLSKDGADEPFSALDLRIDHRTAEGKALSASGNYYVGEDGMRAAEWGGAFAEALGLKGGPFTERDFKRVMFGLDPRTGERMDPGIPSPEEQEAADREKNRAEAAHDKSKEAYWAARALARDAGRDPESDKACLEAKSAMDRAREDKASARGAKGNRLSAKDLTFSMPKAMSMYVVKLRDEGRGDPAKALLANRIMEAWTRSIHGTMAHVEKRKALLRPRSGKGTRHVEPTAGICYAVVGHVDARPVDGVVDPQVHSHVLLMNRALDHADGNSAVWYDEIVEDVKTLGADQRLRFVQELRGLGIETAIDRFDTGGGEFTSFTLYGVGEEETDAFSRRSAQVAANQEAGMAGSAAKRAGREAKNEMTEEEILGQCAARMEGLGLTSESMVSSRRERHAKWREEIVASQTRAWEAENDAFMAGAAPGGDQPKAPSKARPPGWQEAPDQAEAWEARIDSLLEARVGQRESIPSTPEEMLAAVMRRSPVVTIPEIERMILEFGMTQDLAGRDLDKWRDDMLAGVLALDELVEVERDETTGEALRQSRARGLDRFGRPVFTTRAQREAEERFYGKTVPEMLDDRSQKRLARGEANAAVDAWEAENNVRLSKQQRRAVADIVTNPSRLGLVQAWAGTGKTMMSKCAVKILKDMGYNVLCLAPSNKAAVGLRDEVASGRRARDFASSLGVEPEKAYTPESLALAVEGGRVELGRGTIVYADESSMLDGHETRRLFDAAAPAVDPDTGAETGGARFILLGDERQIQAIESGNVIKRLSKLCSERMVSAATEAAARNGAGAEGDETRQISMMTEGWGDYRNVQRQARAVGKQIVAWAETGQALKALDSIDRRGMLKRHGTDARLVEAVATGYVGRACAEASAAGPARKAYMRAAKGGDPAATAAARAVWESSLEAVRRFHEARVILAQTNDRVNAINAAVRERLRESGLIGDKEVSLAVGGAGGRRSIGISVGDRLSWSEKMTHADARFLDKGGRAKGRGEVLKTETGTVVGVSFDAKGRPQAHVALDGDKGTVVVGAGFKGLNHAYAMTVAKSQGISRDHVEVVGSPRGNIHDFLVSISRFKRSMSVHVLEHEMEGYAKTIAVESRKIEATDLAAAEYGFLEPELAEIYKEEARGAEEAARAFELSMGRLDAQARGANGRETDAKARNPLAARVVELMGAGIARLRGRPLPADPDPALTALMPALERAAAAAGRPIGHAAKLGIAAKSDPAALLDGAVREWLAVDGRGAVLAFNQRSGQVEGWAPGALAGRGELAEMARQRLGVLGDAAPEAGVVQRWTHEGRIVEIGESPFGGRPGAKTVPHVDLQLGDGTVRRMQGVDLRRGVEAAGLRVGDWALLDDSRRVEVEIIVAAGAEGSEGILECRVLKIEGGKGRSLVETPDGRTAYATGEAHAQCVAAGQRGTVELGHARLNKVAWEAQRGTEPNRIPVGAREAAWAAIRPKLDRDPGLMAAAGRMGQAEGSLAALWRGAGDVVEASAEIDGAPVWQMAGARTGTDDFGATSSTATRVYAIHADAERVYCVAATEDRDGIGLASERILAIPIGDAPHLSVGRWGVVACDGVSTRSIGVPEIVAAAEAGDVARVRELVAQGRAGDADALGRTALHAAAEGGSAEAVAFLRRAGLSTGDRDAEGRTSMDVARGAAVAAMKAELAPERPANPARDALFARLEADGGIGEAVGERLCLDDLAPGRHSWTLVRRVGAGRDRVSLLSRGDRLLALDEAGMAAVGARNARQGGRVSFEAERTASGAMRIGREASQTR